ncbi:MAG: hypothetical protein RSD17_04885, partial [Oscillospiraceae bacterium]
IGNHSFTHSKQIGFFSKEKMMEEILLTDISIAKFLGKKSRYLHSTFHMFVLVGSILHFISVLYML